MGEFRIRGIRWGLLLAAAALSAAAQMPAHKQGGAAPRKSTVQSAAAAASAQCTPELWKHVYKPARLIVKQKCIAVTGVIVDATANQKQHHADGVRHEPDGDSHGWLKVDPPFADVLNDGNRSNEGGNLVFEIVCRYPISQADAIRACRGYQDEVQLPPVGSHVRIVGTFVQDTNHEKWNEIHPVTSIAVVP
ncbi:MAG TPA: hypothetical protein VJ738_00160 [Steroidobacteraceae bacterium]|nr:hypothetical protein [Steroidobacteraceae bacterium]